MMTYTCPHGGQEIMAETRDLLETKIDLHYELRHPPGRLRRCQPVAGVAPIQQAYCNTSAQGTTRGGY